MTSAARVWVGNLNWQSNGLDKFRQDNNYEQSVFSEGERHLVGI